MSRLTVPAPLALLMFVLLNSISHAQTFSVLYDFGTNRSDPLQPTFSGIIAQGRDGNLYSTTPSGGTHNAGTFFKITPTGTLSVPYAFQIGGYNPLSGVVLGTDGNLYGTANVSTGYCFDGFCGTAFKITPGGQMTVLYNFTGSNDGAFPTAPPVEGTDGNFYGTAFSSANNNGTVYRVTPDGQFTALYQFDKTHGAHPYAPLVQGNDGNFYGVTQMGGNVNLGVVFRITPSGNLTVLYNFDGPHGSQPVAPLVQGNDRNFYGTTFDGGKNGSGVVFKITPAGQLIVIHNFEGEAGGFYPIGGLVLATDGNFYGTTRSGGATDQGTIFRISAKGSYSVLHEFSGTEGTFPEVTLIQRTNGILYGDTSQGGSAVCDTPYGCGTFYSLNLGLPAFVTLLPTSGKVGKTVEVLGQGFQGTTGVSFNGTVAKFKVVSSTYLTATVPKGATAGFVVVTTPGGRLKSNREFRLR